MIRNCRAVVKYYITLKIIAIQLCLILHIKTMEFEM
jgi:hypothetical protein